jgi:single-stranded DNA-binding protein
VNHVSLVGRLARAPSVKCEGEGQHVCTFTLFVTEPSRAGTPYVLYIPCTSWGKAAEACALLNAEDLVAVLSPVAVSIGHSN